MIKRKSKHEYYVELGKISPTPYTQDDMKNVLAWCTETFGQGGRNKKYRWRYGWVARYNDRFYFRKESDALMFVLRWA